MLKLSLLLIPTFSFVIFTSNVMGKEKVKEKEELLTIQDAQSDDEAFLVRRIAEFWKDGDYDIVKSQIKDFLVKYPHSISGDLLRGILGDLYLQEKKYQIALESYASISEASVNEKILLNKLQCYYELENYFDLTAEALPYVTSPPESFEDRMDEFHFLVAEGFFHQAFDTTDENLKEELLELAEPHYEQLAQTPYADTALFATAEINRLLGRPKKASEIYLELSTRFPSDEEELLFQMASMQALFDKALAIESFEKISKRDGNRSYESRFNQMVLYFQQDEFTKVLKLEEELLPSLSEEQKGLFHYIVGKSYFNENDYASASRHIQNYLEYDFAPGPLHKNALLILMTAAAQNENEFLFDTTLSQFKENYPSDDELPKALFMHALICKEQGNYSKQGERLEHLVTNYPNFEDRESLLFEFGVFCHEQQRWKDCYETFSSYLNDYANSSRHIGARKFFISASLHLLKANQESSEAEYNVNQLTADLEKALEGENMFPPKERAQYKLLYAKTLYSTGSYEKSLQMISSLEEELNDTNFLAEVYYLRAEANYQLQKAPNFFYEPMEKAIEFNPDLAENGAVQLQLYNSYIMHVKILSELESSDEMVQEKKEELFEKAASHLYTAFSSNSEHIKLENRLWLANHYYKKAADLELFDPTGENFITAVNLYEKILLLGSERELAEITPESLFIEQETLKYAELLGYQNIYDEKVRILKHLAEAQHAHPDWDWHLQNEVLLQLAKSYEQLEDLESALETYVFLQRTDDQGFAALATFHSSKIKFLLLDRDQMLENNDHVRNILNELKELQIRKNPASEPLHLEAGLEYASIRSKISEDTKQNDRYLFFLKRLKEDFESVSDPIAMEYKEKLTNIPEKKSLYDSYMKFIEAEVLRTEAKIKHAQKGVLEAEELNSQALAILSELQSARHLDPYLQKRLNESIDEINSFEAYN